MSNTDNNNHYNTIIIGGGASGMMAAICAAESGSNKVLIIEKNSEMGKKLKITGGGRCNILNAEYDTEKLLSNYVGSKKYLHTPFSRFGVTETVEFFKNIGIDIKIEDRKRAFPKSEKALDVFNAMLTKIESFKNEDGSKVIEIKLNTKIESFSLTQNKVEYIEVVNNKGVVENIYANKFILSTGGMSHKETGSDGFGFKLLEKMGIKIDDFTPSLVPVAVSNNWVKKLSGKSIENIKLTFYVDNIKKKVLKLNKLKNEIDTYYENTLNTNRVLFTHSGLSGPTILNNSKYISDWLHEGKVTVKIDLFPFLDEKGVDDTLLNIFNYNKNKMLKNVLNDIYVGNILEEIFLDKGNPLFDIDLDREVHSVTKSERRKMVNVFKNLEIEITSLMSYDKAIIADGGVNLDEVNFDNFSLKKVKNLHVTGDMLNISRPSGGYSLQLCWTTGYAAGSN